jgi:hypothetical protein
MQKLSENNLIKLGFFYFILPAIFVGIAGFWLPYVYAIIPVPNSSICFCSLFFQIGEADVLIKNNFLVLVTINIFSFYGINFGFLCILTIMVWQIRKIKDSTLISKECTTIIGVWLILSAFQTSLFLFQESYSCQEGISLIPNKLNVENYIFKISYWIQILRNLCTLSIMLGFQIYVDWQEKTYMAGVLATEGQDNMHALKDFDFLLESVMPHKYFSLYLI